MDKYITMGIHETLDEFIQAVLWNALDMINKKELDYLQIFKIKNYREITII